MQLLSHGWNTLSKGQGGADHPVARVIDAIATDFPEGADPPDQTESPKTPPDDAAEGERETAGVPTDDDTNTGVPYALYAPHVVVFYALAHLLAVKLQNKLIDVTPKPDHLHLRDLSFRQVPATPQRRTLLERRGYVRRGPLERPMNFCLIPADQGDKSFWKMRGYLRCGTGHRSPHLPLGILDIVKSDMTTWLSEPPAIGDPCPS